MEVFDARLAARDHVQQALIIPVASHKHLLEVLQLIQRAGDSHHLVMHVGELLGLLALPVGPVELERRSSVDCSPVLSPALLPVPAGDPDIEQAIYGVFVAGAEDVLVQGEPMAQETLSRWREDHRERDGEQLRRCSRGVRLLRECLHDAVAAAGRLPEHLSRNLDVMRSCELRIRHHLQL